MSKADSNSSELIDISNEQLPLVIYYRDPAEVRTIRRQTYLIALLTHDQFAEILPRFISKPISNKGHIRIFSDRDLLIYWVFAWDSGGAWDCLVFITPRSGVKVSRPLPIKNQ